MYSSATGGERWSYFCLEALRLRGMVLALTLGGEFRSGYSCGRKSTGPRKLAEHEKRGFRAMSYQFCSSLSGRLTCGAGAGRLFIGPALLVPSQRMHNSVELNDLPRHTLGVGP